MALKINFFFEGTKRFAIRKNDTIQWIGRVAEHYGARIARLRIIHCSDEVLWEMNRNYLDHDTYTDIITFPFSEPGDPVEGELYISTDRVKENAAQEGVSFEDEWHRVIVHGILHLLGYDDQSGEQLKRMREQEDYCLTLRTL
ncbi:MAG TPA: rRNA maturation RNase YbeY [Bacteroidales bacterium]|nr:rRNA maturation RNase YbeY [Bacteroidales bacterium]HRZ49687.1 rRNA maturation RNase YbeY [Bacteroidales bacterium]